MVPDFDFFATATAFYPALLDLIQLDSGFVLPSSRSIDPKPTWPAERKPNEREIGRQAKVRPCETLPQDVTVTTGRLDRFIGTTNSVPASRKSTLQRLKISVKSLIELAVWYLVGQ